MPQFSSFPHVEDCTKRIRAYINGVCLVDTIKAKFVWLHPYYPTYYFSDFNFDSPYISAPTEVGGGKKEYTIKVGQSEPKTLTLYTTGELAGLATVKFSDMDMWFEEDEEIFVHPKDPYKRVDILQSSRHIRVELNGVVLAETRSARLLFETLLSVRTYIPKTDCKMELWVPSKLKTSCPYKGTASYYDVVLPSGEKFKDIIWWYPTTILETAPIQGYVAFYDEKVDVFVDGVKQKRPSPVVK